MELIFSNYPPLGISKHKNTDVFVEHLRNSDEIQIASGYISAAALVELQKFVELNGTKLSLLIGMHYFDSFTRNQYNAAMELARYVDSKKLGTVKISTVFPFHGKMYSFIKGGKTTAAIIGSSNLSSLLKSSNRLYESDVLFLGKDAIEISESIAKVTEKIGENIRDVKITDFIEPKSLLENDYLVEKVPLECYNYLLQRKGIYQFDIQLKSTPKSNLNVFFGKGRENKTNGRTLPRPWYEVEIIVSKAITSKTGYPANKIFTVITDDGWKFTCNTNGQNSKNLRSKDDLLILGKWIKGRLEQTGKLNVGELYTDEIGAKYGRNSISLISTKEDNTWLLDYHV